MRRIPLISNCQSSTKSNFLLLEPFNNAGILQIGLEVAVRLSLAGNYVNYIHYGEALPIVEWYQRNGCFKDRLLGYPPSPQRRGIAILRQIKHCYKLPLSLKNQSKMHRYDTSIYSLDKIQTINELQHLSYAHNNSLGLSVASSLISMLRDPNVNPSTQKDLCEKLVQSYIASFHIARQNLGNKKASALIICNGRFACTKGAVDAARQLGIPTFFFERGSTPRKFSLRAFHPHDRVASQDEIKRVWSNVSHEEGSHLAHIYYEKRRNATNEDWLSFIENQTSEHTITVMSQAKRSSKSGKIIVYFSSSDDELASVQDFYSQYPASWSNQKEALHHLIVSARQCGHSIIVRVHPNLETCSQNEKDAWNTLSFIDDLADVYIVPSYSLASSYHLLDSSDLVASYGSTMGIEAVHWGKPSLLLGDSLYDLLGASIIKISSGNALVDYLLNPSAWSAKPSTADSYGYYMSTFGYDHIMYKPSSLFSGSFLGHDLHSYPKTRLHKLVDFLKGRRRSNSSVA